MLRNLQTLTPVQRRLIFFLLIVGGLALLIGVTALLASFALNSGRTVSRPLPDGISVREFAQLPDDDAYPAAIAVAPDGTVYTGSFASGAVWSITPDGGVTEVAGTRDAIGAVIGLAVAPDGALLVLDQIDTDPRSNGGRLWRAAGGAVEPFGADIGSGGFSAPYGIAVDGGGFVYVADAGRSEVWRFNPDGSNSLLWYVPPAVSEDDARNAPTGLAYDPLRDMLVITDSERATITRVQTGVGIGSPTILTVYNHGERADRPVFDGITVAPQGSLIVTDLNRDAIAIVREGDVGELEYLAEGFRGANDVAFAAPNRVYVTNFNQLALAAPLVEPELPFAIDLVELNIPLAPG